MIGQHTDEERLEQFWRDYDARWGDLHYKYASRYYATLDSGDGDAIREAQAAYDATWAVRRAGAGPQFTRLNAPEVFSGGVIAETVHDVADHDIRRAIAELHGLGQSTERDAAIQLLGARIDGHRTTPLAVRLRKELAKMAIEYRNRIQGEASDDS